MKQSFFSILQDGQTDITHFLVCENEIRATLEVTSYLRLELGDATGRVEARMWDRFDQMAATFERDDFVKVQARVENYRNKMQLAIEKIRRAEESEVDPADFFPHTKEDVEKMYGRRLDIVASVKHPLLRLLLDSVVQEQGVVPRLMRAPAENVIIHAYYGGLLEHVLSLSAICAALGPPAIIPKPMPTCLLSGAVLHDIGILEELSYERSLGYTDEGQLLGHILDRIRTRRQENRRDRWISARAENTDGAHADLSSRSIRIRFSEVAHVFAKLCSCTIWTISGFQDGRDPPWRSIPIRGKGTGRRSGGALQRRLLRTECLVTSRGRAFPPEKKPAAQAAVGGRG